MSRDSPLIVQETLTVFAELFQEPNFDSGSVSSVKYFANILMNGLSLVCDAARNSGRKGEIEGISLELTRN